MWKVYSRTPRRFRIFVTQKRTYETLCETYCNLSSLDHCLRTLDEEYPDGEVTVTELMTTDYEKI